MEPYEPGAYAATVNAAIAEIEGAVLARKLRTKKLPYLGAHWNSWNRARRKKHVNKVFDWKQGGANGAPLRQLRSEVVERWLGWSSLTR
jgi:hypothetical protein